jgi:hypothetical protein
LLKAERFGGAAPLYDEAVCCRVMRSSYGRGSSGGVTFTGKPTIEHFAVGAVCAPRKSENGADGTTAETRTP